MLILVFIFVFIWFHKINIKITKYIFRPFTSCVHIYIDDFNVEGWNGILVIHIQKHNLISFFFSMYFFKEFKL